jgi:hypothetical protein
MLPPLGALRMYVKDEGEPDRWLRIVGELTAASQLVIMRVGAGKRFDRELEMIFKACDPRKVLVYLPKKTRWADYCHFRKRAEAILSKRLPDDLGSAQFLCFRDDWEPRLVASYGGTTFSLFRRYFLTGSAAPALRDALNPHLASIGLTSRRLPLQLREWLLILLLPYTALVLIASLLRVLAPVVAPLPGP